MSNVFVFFLLWKRPRDVGNVITSGIRVTITAMIFDFARSGALVCCNVPILGKYRLALHFESNIVYECTHGPLFVL